MEQALVDLTRIGLSGDVNGVRQLGRRFARRPPADAAHPTILKELLFSTLAAATQPESTLLRSADNHGSSDIHWTQHPSELNAPILVPEVRRSIDLIIAEHASPERLQEFDLLPSRAVLFTGPPGVGKTLTAGYIASALNLPLVTLNLASLMSSLMGQTGKNLQDFLSQASSEPCILFLDEFDAIAKSRVDKSDVGEVKRLVNVVLQQLDQWPTGSLLVAATNHPQLLDSAVHRRFDATIEFKLPGFEERVAFLEQSKIRAIRVSDETTLRVIALISEGWSLADLDSWTHRAAREAILSSSDGPVNVEESILQTAKERAHAWASRSPEKRAQLSRLTAERLGWTHRKIADWLGVSHVTIGKDIKRTIGDDDV